MIRNYLITAFRSIIRQKGYSLIIIIGLTVSITVFGLILLYVKHEYSIDKFNKNINQIYRLETEEWAILGTAYGPELAANLPEIESFARVSCFEGASVTVQRDNNLMKLENMLYADSAFVNFFSFNFIEGNPKHALSTPFSVILTQSEARKIFGDEDPMGKLIKVNNKHDFTITGIIQDIHGFHIQTNAIASFQTLVYSNNDSNFMNHYDQWNYYTFFHLRQNTDPKQLEQKIIRYYTGKANWIDSKPYFQLRPLMEIYFTHVKYDISGYRGNRIMLLLFLSIGIFIVIIACVNFINLTTARSATRSKEIGIRKVMGAGKQNLMLQFLGESVIITFISTELALVLIELLRPFFSNLIGREILFGNDTIVWMLVMAILFPVIIGIIAGFYPAVYLNRLQPITTLKREKTSGKGALVFRRILITFQFTVSIILIIATFTVNKQLNYIKNKELGFDKHQVLTVNLNSELLKNIETFRERLLSNSAIQSVAFSTQPFGNVSWQESINIQEENKQYTFLGTEPEFITTMGLHITQGRNFDRKNQTDQGKVILNEEGVRYFGLNSPVGSIIGSKGRQFEVIGVMDNAFYNSLHSPIAPLVMMWNNQYSRVASIRINGSPKQALDHIEKVWSELSAGFILEYSFLDESFDQLYKSEIRLSRLFMYMALLAIIIACIGLLGLASYLAEQRTKEIGIRKVLGARESDIIRLVTREFTVWILLSGFIAVPLAWYIMNKWLNQFAYHTNLDAIIFIISCLITLVLALITVSWQSYRSANLNPVDALKCE